MIKTFEITLINFVRLVATSGDDFFLSANNLRRQFETRSHPSKCLAYSKLLETLTEFLKYNLQNDIVKKN